ncbi:hypothetical protein GCM10023221_09310 [Luteimicrobium xylanilyticum]|uniref:Mannan endo-1,4-beta-mannosidase n=1 Tax=Luteimicrobium xylanilyticum TaxID=1133546 RepID=A0A5P9QD73_9MICO|nr:hypothetical protein [Luteimicrobium xylanilyticum]QFU99060.1 Mannan endo-1,4-beta-mannosidase [Luteimicrobium xylanilyticum]
MRQLFVGGRRAAAVATFAAVVAAGVTTPAVAAFAAPHTASSVTLAASAATKPHVTSSPKSVVVATGHEATFKVKSSGAHLAFRWYVSTNGKTWKKIAKATHASYTVKAKASLNGHRYRVVVKNVHGSVTSKSAKLTVAVKPHVTRQPHAAVVVTGKKASFTVHATGNALHVQWYAKAPGKSYVKVARAASARYTVTASAAKNGYRYKAAVSNKAGRVTTSSAKLTVITKPKITKQPLEGQQVASGTSVTLSVRASGVGLTYQWQYVDDSADGDYDYHVIKGATGSTYTFTATTRTHDDLRVVVSNKAGKVASDDSFVLVDSSVDDPYGPDGMALLNSWIVTLDAQAKGGVTVVSGDNPTTIKTSFQALPGNHAEVGDLSFALVVDGREYPATVSSKAYAGGDYGFVATATADVTRKMAEAGVWKVTDSSGKTPVTQYFAQG